MCEWALTEEVEGECVFISDLTRPKTEDDIPFDDGSGLHIIHSLHLEIHRLHIPLLHASTVHRLHNCMYGQSTDYTTTCLDSS